MTARVRIEDRAPHEAFWAFAVLTKKRDPEHLNRSGALHRPPRVTWVWRGITDTECGAGGDLHLSHFGRDARNASAGFALFMPRNVRDWLQLIECIVAIYILSRVARYLFYKIVGRL
jgi:hypothetical protein